MKEVNSKGERFDTGFLVFVCWISVLFFFVDIMNEAWCLTGSVSSNLCESHINLARAYKDLFCCRYSDIPGS